MATTEQVQHVREQNYADWEASVHHNERLARLRGEVAQDMGGVAVAALTAGVFADRLPATPVIEREPIVALPEEARRSFGATALSHELRMNPSGPVLTSSEVYTGYAQVA